MNPLQPVTQNELPQFGSIYMDDTLGQEMWECECGGMEIIADKSSLEDIAVHLSSDLHMRKMRTNAVSEKKLSNDSIPHAESMMLKVHDKDSMPHAESLIVTKKEKQSLFEGIGKRIARATNPRPKAQK